MFVKISYDQKSNEITMSEDESGIEPFRAARNSLALPNFQDDTEINHDTISSGGPQTPLNDLTRNESQLNGANMEYYSQSVESLDVLGLSSTSPEENSRWTREYVSLVMSIIYAVLLVSVALIISAVSGVGYPSLIYSICVCGIGFIYLLFLMYDIGCYKSNELKHQKNKSLEESDGLIRQDTTHDGQDTTHDGSPKASVSQQALIPPKHYYCFSRGRHSETFYLKLGALGFAMGHLIHSILQISVQFGFLFDANIDNNQCIRVPAIVLDIMQPCYCLLQLYFIFKYSNVIILRYKCMVYFAFMHMIGSSLCFWIQAIGRETTLILTIYAYAMYGNSNGGSRKYSDEEINKKLGSFINIEDLYRENCTGSPALSSIIGNVSPYLYPFTVEFNILIVAFYYTIWSNIGNCKRNDTNTGNSSTTHLPCTIPNSNEDDDEHSNIVIHADCSKSLRGLFAGIVMIVIVIGTLIIGFVLGNVGGKFQKFGYLLKDVIKLGIHSSMLIAAVIAFVKLRRLDINKHPMSLLDDVLLFICLPAFFLETVLSMIATVNIVNVLKSIDVIVMVLQVVVQTPLIIMGLRRCSNSKKLRRSKPGRQLLMFLLIANVSTWLFNTFSYKSPDGLDERYEYYGKVLWTVLGHISLPLMMFYRFHSSVCLVDIWDSAYKPGEDH